MNLSLFIARRYLFSKNNRNAINIISFIAILVLTVASAALIIVLSVFNGIDKMISERINLYAPDLKIIPVSGKTFSMDSDAAKEILHSKFIETYSAVLEENILLKSDYKQLIATAKGVDDNYEGITNVDDLLLQGEYAVKSSNNYAVFGIGLAIQLGISLPASSSVSVWIPDRKNISTMRPESAFRTMHLIPTGLAQVEEDFDNKYIICSLKELQLLTDRPKNEISALEIKLKEGTDFGDAEKHLRELSGDDLIVQNRPAQYDFLYSIMQSEKLATFLILSFIILIAGFSITGSVIMLIIEKKDNMRTLLNMGCQYKNIKKIFLLQGMLITGLAGIIGLSLGAAFCISQQMYGYIGYAIDQYSTNIPYPVDLRLSDFVYSFVAILLIGSLISSFPIMHIKRFLSD